MNKENYTTGRQLLTHSRIASCNPARAATRFTIHGTLWVAEAVRSNLPIV